MQSQQKEDNAILLTRNNFTKGQYHVIEVMAKTLDQTVSEYLKDTLLESIQSYVESDMVPEILISNLKMEVV
ncbi:MAG: hypothetical protein ACR2IS_19610 [Nitrososphaeraceae archaeon]